MAALPRHRRARGARSGPRDDVRASPFVDHAATPRRRRARPRRRSARHQRGDDRGDLRRLHQRARRGRARSHRDRPGTEGGGMTMRRALSTLANISMRHALSTLAKCPTTGAPQSILLARGVSQEALDRLVRRGLARTRVAKMANPRGLEVTWYLITMEGRGY